MAKTIQIEKHNLILISVVAVLFITVIILLFTIFKSKGTVTSSKDVSILDTVIKYQNLLIDEKNLRLSEKDSTISFQFDIIRSKDSLIQISLSNEKKHIQNYNQIPTAVRNINSKDALRGEVRGFTGH